MRNVLVVLFWLWVLAALGVYAFRLYRRMAHGPKRDRTATSSSSGGPGGRDDPEGPTTDGPRRTGLLAGLSASPPPLPDGPVEARPPRSLQDRPGPAATGDGAPGAPTTPPAPDARPEPAAPRPQSLAEALEGIRMPEELLPVVDPTASALDQGRQADFAGTGTNVPTVAVAIGDELKRLGYVVDGLDTITSSRAGISAHRDGTTVAATVGLDDDTGAVVLHLST